MKSEKIVVDIKRLTKKYKEFTAVDTLNLEIKEGDIFGLLGPNGSGKTTTINCMLSLLKFDSGNIKIFGEETKPTSYEIKRNIGIVMQDVAVFNELSVRDNIEYFCGLYVKDKKIRKKLVDEAIEFTGLKEFVDFRPKKLSGGLLRRLNIACGIAHKPKLIILDEPTVAVDPQSRNSILEGIKKLNIEGSTIIYTSHYMDEIEQLCNNIAIIDKGKVIAKGTKEEIKELAKAREKVSIELVNAPSNIVEEILKLKNVHSAVLENKTLKVLSRRGNHSLNEILYYCQSENIEVGNIYSEEPTLNDAFLELTGKELRDYA